MSAASISCGEITIQSTWSITKTLIQEPKLVDDASQPLLFRRGVDLLEPPICRPSHSGRFWWQLITVVETSPRRCELATNAVGAIAGALKIRLMLRLVSQPATPTTAKPYPLAIDHATPLAARGTSEPTPTPAKARGGEREGYQFIDVLAGTA